MRQIRIRLIVFFSLLGFLLGIASLAFHHHDNDFLRPFCMLCKAKTSFSGTIKKFKVQTTPAPLMFCLFPGAIFICLSGLLPDGGAIFIESQVVDVYPNKAPPLSC